MTPPPLDVSAVRAAFPGLDPDEAYLDMAATAPKPRAVLDALTRAYTEAAANVHRGVYRRAERATALFEDARARVARFLGASDPAELVWVRGATEGLNLLAHGLGEGLAPGDEVVVTALEHHANLLPWQRACRRSGARLRALPLTAEGALCPAALSEAVGPRTRVVAVSHASNALGTVLPVAELSRAARRVGALCVVDGCQMAPHAPVDVQALGVDAYVISGHKLYGPTGIGAVWARRALWETLPPWLVGGEMVTRVRLDDATWAPPPHRFEAGTQHIAGAIGLAAAVTWLEELGWPALRAHEEALRVHAEQALDRVPGLVRVGTATPRVPLVAFTLDGIHPHDVAGLLSEEGVAVRAGHHCAQPALAALGHEATVRASFGAATTHDEVDRLVAGLAAVRALLGRP